MEIRGQKTSKANELFKFLKRSEEVIAALTTTTTSL